MRQAFQVLMSQLLSADTGPRPKRKQVQALMIAIFFGDNKLNLVLIVKYLPNFNI
jgi:hypothetical protein